ncbi:hypothetical protein [Streptomyces sp. NPDC058953]|uniref:hypothetical protein n=1 Tax=unclassified Streptomyces TaxID=2593676 RepID=UPI0036C62636
MTELPRFQGRVVPWITPWSGAPALGEPVVVAAGGWGIGYADESVYDRTYDGVLLARGRGRRASDVGGRPLYEEVDPRRQHRAAGELLCQVCGRKPPADLRGLLWVLPGGEEKELEDALILTPPVCPEPCAVLAVEQCPFLARGFTAVRVRYPRPWGYRGTLYGVDSSGRGVVRRCEESVQLPHEDPRLSWLLADLAVTRFMGCSVVGLG